jgi:CIC family chloride channel protein
MIISALSYFIKYHYQKIPIFLADQGQYHIARRHHESLPLNQLSVEDLVETDFEKVPLKATLKKMLPLIGKSHRNLFPVIGPNDELAGILLLDDIRSIMFNPRKHGIQIKNLMHAPPAVIQINENMSDVMQKFDRTEAWNLPVLRGDEYVGFLSKSRIFSAYRKELFESRTLE